MNQPQHQQQHGSKDPNRRQKYFDKIARTPSMTIFVRSPFIGMCVNALKLLEQQVAAAGESLSRGQLSPQDHQDITERVLGVHAYIKDTARTIDKKIGRIPGRPTRPGGGKTLSINQTNGAGNGHANGTAHNGEAKAPASADKPTPAPAIAVAPVVAAAKAEEPASGKKAGPRKLSSSGAKS